MGRGLSGLFSYGFRPGRGPQDALDALWVGIVRKKVNWIVDLDIRSFFDKVEHDHGWSSSWNIGSETGGSSA
jgi:retron-type reverse transcriptase